MISDTSSTPTHTYHIYIYIYAHTHACTHARTTHTHTHTHTHICTCTTITPRTSNHLGGMRSLQHLQHRGLILVCVSRRLGVANSHTLPSMGGGRWYEGSVEIRALTNSTRQQLHTYYSALLLQLTRYF